MAALGPGMPEPHPMAVHVRVAALLHLVAAGLAALALLVGAVAALAAQGWMTRLAELGGVPTAVLGLLLFAGIPAYGMLAAVGGVLLLRRRVAARFAVAVVGAVSLFSFPVGTAFGAYSLFAVLHRKTDTYWVDPLPGSPTDASTL